MDPLIGIVMGSDSDLPTMKAAAEVCEEFGVPYEMNIISAHRTPIDMANYGQEAHRRGLRVIIAGAGGAAHLPGMIAAHTPLPVIGVPIRTESLGGMDSLLSIVQMPPGVPVATVAIGGAKNAALLAIEIIATSDPSLLERVIRYKQKTAEMSREKNKRLREGTKER
ncbi:MAG TPA: 5-(carboxyamino)imidazole ribonucleotide mutase [Thermodesulfobacteriota bacterium]|jgi:5-(carboxyamino)imidazole ribonucleotide mutase|nr:5-(carboxyamino)imidazole ribonucleotide mutase [Thermodesulfobacteriota bacterium]